MMKKIAMTLLLFSLFQLQAQELPKNEVKWNIAGTIVFASVELGYEYFLDNHQSVGAEVHINDVYNFSVGRQVKDFNTNSFQLTYNYYTGDEASEFVISPMLKFRFGDYQKSADYPIIDMNSFILGIGLGYKWNLNNKFVFGPYASIGRNFSQTVNDEFDIPIEFSGGFGIGYRF